MLNCARARMSDLESTSLQIESVTSNRHIWSLDSWLTIASLERDLSGSYLASKAVLEFVEKSNLSRRSVGGESTVHRSDWNGSTSGRSTQTYTLGLLNKGGRNRNPLVKHNLSNVKTRHDLIPSLRNVVER